MFERGVVRAAAGREEDLVAVVQVGLLDELGRRRVGQHEASAGEHLAAGDGRRAADSELDRVDVGRTSVARRGPVGVAHEAEAAARDVAGPEHGAGSVGGEHVGPGRDDVVAVGGGRLRVQRLRILRRDGRRQRQHRRLRDERGGRARELEDDRVVVRRLDAGDRAAARSVGADDVAVIRARVGARDVRVEAALDRVGDVSRRHLAVHRRTDLTPLRIFTVSVLPSGEICGGPAARSGAMFVGSVGLYA